MYKLGWIACLLVWMSTAASADEKEVKSRITSVGLFKNGLALVSRTVVVPTSGTYRIADVPEPVHGTFWIESDAKVVTRLTRRKVEVPIGSPGDLQEELSGLSAVIHFKDGNIPPASGRIVEFTPPKGEEAWNRNFQPTTHYGYYGNATPSMPKRFLVLENKKGRTYVDTAHIAYLSTEGAAAKPKRLKPVMLLEVSDVKKKPATLRISYLAKGMAWAPSYRVDISNPKKLTLVQKAIVKNELARLDRASIALISGFPSVKFSHVTSPMSLRTNWQSFFTQLSNAPRPGHASLDNMVTQQRVSFNRPAPGLDLDLSAIPTGDGVDLHYQEIGRHSLDEGESMAVQTASARASYERIVEWTVPDTRGADGQHISRPGWNQGSDRDQDAAWDAIRFRNPLPFPMTTAPAIVVDGDRFNGQRMSYWVNRGEMTTLRITKALSIRTRQLEVEEKGKRKDLYRGGDRYYRATVKGELQANNHRKETVTLVIRRKFYGDLVKADRSPKCMLTQEGVYSVNKHNQCTWTVKLKPGQDVKLDYRYTVLVRY